MDRRHGLGRQRIFIAPELDLVVMTTSGLYGSGRQGQAALDILANLSFRMSGTATRADFPKQEEQEA